MECISVAKCITFHRVIVDESHLSGASLRADCVKVINSPLRWGVTATPLVGAGVDLKLLSNH